ncbi:hypothetical protein KGA66_06310 [Actinocrinis puniceicyclus]|uniref:Uncharacterized protein n=1 Tax=Actinocrinis puniceicyclus TaxID=977794 RepID=A0A8J8BBN4_9ACTN|nr:hypothetical protein [Actinocrinis puniceicyclus]MBS2962650.1 hypothetical protein [Actinocrinis puniceicyclus]
MAAWHLARSFGAGPASWVRPARAETEAGRRQETTARAATGCTRPKVGCLDAPAGLSDVTVARYIAKYATKSAESAGVELPPLA